MIGDETDNSLPYEKWHGRGKMEGRKAPKLVLGTEEVMPTLTSEGRVSKWEES